MTEIGGILREGDGPGFACRAVFSWCHCFLVVVVLVGWLELNLPSIIIYVQGCC